MTYVTFEIMDGSNCTFDTLQRALRQHPDIHWQLPLPSTQIPISTKHIIFDQDVWGSHIIVRDPDKNRSIQYYYSISTPDIVMLSEILNTVLGE